MGIVSLAFEGIPYSRNKEVVNVGPIQASAETTEKIPLPPVVGGLALAGGLALIAVGVKKS